MQLFSNARDDTFRITVGWNALDSVENRRTNTAIGQQPCLVLLKGELPEPHPIFALRLIGLIRSLH